MSPTLEDNKLHSNLWIFVFYPTPLPCAANSPLCSVAKALLTTSILRKKVAIIGSGAAGIGALWALNRTRHDVYIYEAADRLGGHTNTVEYAHGKQKTMVDTGFIVLNTATYRSSTFSTSNLWELIFLGSQLYCILESYPYSYGAYGNDIRSISRWRVIRMVWDLSCNSFLPAKKHFLATNVEDDIRYHTL